MMPYTPIDALHAMHREHFKEHLHPDDLAAGRRTDRHRDDRPDPIGLAWAGLRPRQWLATIAEWLGRTGRTGAGQPRKRAT